MGVLERELEGLLGNRWVHRILWLKAIWILTLVTVVAVGAVGFVALIFYAVVAWKWGVPWTQSWTRRERRHHH